MQDAMGDHDRGDDGKEYDQRIEHGNRPELLEIVFAEKRQIDREADHEDGDVEDLSHDGGADLLVGIVAAVHLLLIRYEDVVGLAVYDVAPVDDLLSALGDAAGQRDAVVEVAQAGLAPLFIVAEVGGDVVVQVALLQDLPVFLQLRVLE